MGAALLAPAVLGGAIGTTMGYLENRQANNLRGSRRVNQGFLEPPASSRETGDNSSIAPSNDASRSDDWPSISNPFDILLAPEESEPPSDPSSEVMEEETPNDFNYDFLQTLHDFIQKVEEYGLDPMMPFTEDLKAIADQTQAGLQVTDQTITKLEDIITEFMPVKRENPPPQDQPVSFKRTRFGAEEDSMFLLAGHYKKGKFT